MALSYRIAGIRAPGRRVARTADRAERLEFWPAVVRFGLLRKDQELAAGIDRFGQPMVPIAPRRTHRRSAMGPADPNAPPLTPAHALSRTRSLLDGRAHDGSRCFSGGSIASRAGRGGSCSITTAREAGGSRSAT